MNDKTVVLNAGLMNYDGKFDIVRILTPAFFSVISCNLFQCVFRWLLNIGALTQIDYIDQ